MATLWRPLAHWAKHQRKLVSLGDKLGRGRGGLRVLDRFGARLPAPARPDLDAFARGALAACWLGHASVLLKLGSLVAVCDPVFSLRVGVGVGVATLGPRRRQRAALSVATLPRVDAVLISHSHFDHLDRPTLSALARRQPHATVVGPRATRDLLGDLGFARCVELDVGEAHQLGDARVEAVPVNHWGARMLADRQRGAQAYLLASPVGRVLFGGDTATQALWTGVGGVDLACVGIGAYDPWIAAHATPEQAYQLCVDAGARHALAMHHEAFVLSNEPMGEPRARWAKAVAERRALEWVCRHVGDVWVRR